MWLLTGSPSFWAALLAEVLLDLLPALDLGQVDRGGVVAIVALHGTDASVGHTTCGRSAARALAARVPDGPRSIVFRLERPVNANPHHPHVRGTEFSDVTGGFRATGIWVAQRRLGGVVPGRGSRARRLNLPCPYRAGRYSRAARRLSCRRSPRPRPSQPRRRRHPQRPRDVDGYVLGRQVELGVERRDLVQVAVVQRARRSSTSRSSVEVHDDADRVEPVGRDRDLHASCARGPARATRRTAAARGRRRSAAWW